MPLETFGNNGETVDFCLRDAKVPETLIFFAFREKMHFRDMGFEFWKMIFRLNEGEHVEL